jgi:hypothetical protein
MAGFGGGPQTLALVLADGGVWTLPTVVVNKGLPRNVLTVTAGADGPPGPTVVTAFDGDRCQGARLVSPGAPAIFAVSGGPRARSVRLEWKTRDGAAHRTTVEIDKPTTAALTPDK